MKLTTISLLAAAAMFAAGCAKDTDTGSSAATAAVQGPDPAAVRHAIDSTNALAAAALASGDTAALMRNYADDAVLLFPNAPVISGRAALSKFAADMFSTISMKDIRMTTTDVMVSGELAVETGTYEWTIVPKGGKPMPETGKYITVWKKQGDGAWKIVRDINNTDMAAK
jgi:uncharacterized protein (TIGR02246 family)